jgi:hypothetical protein
MCSYAGGEERKAHLVLHICQWSCAFRLVRYYIVDVVRRDS